MTRRGMVSVPRAIVSQLAAEGLPGEVAARLAERGMPEEHQLALARLRAGDPRWVCLLLAGKQLRVVEDFLAEAAELLDVIGEYPAATETATRLEPTTENMPEASGASMPVSPGGLRTMRHRVKGYLVEHGLAATRETIQACVLAVYQEFGGELTSAKLSGRLLEVARCVTELSSVTLGGVTDRYPVTAGGVTESVTSNGLVSPPHTPSFPDLIQNKPPIIPLSVTGHHPVTHPVTHGAIASNAMNVTPDFDFEELAADLVAAHPSPRPGRRNNLVAQALVEVWTDCGGDLKRMALLRENTLAWCAHWHVNGFASNLARWIRDAGWLTGPPAPKVAPATEAAPRRDSIDWSAVGAAS